MYEGEYGKTCVLPENKRLRLVKCPTVKDASPTKKGQVNNWPSTDSVRTKPFINLKTDTFRLQFLLTVN